MVFKAVISKTGWSKHKGKKSIFPTFMLIRARRLLTGMPIACLAILVAEVIDESMHYMGGSYVG